VFGSIELEKKLISIDYVGIDYGIVISGSIKIPSKLC
jgi:hypothetical protein